MHDSLSMMRAMQVLRAAKNGVVTASYHKDHDRGAVPGPFAPLCHLEDGRFRHPQLFALAGEACHVLAETKMNSAIRPML
ncbi:uncharacterized protein METZ01_LOCUS288235 [marine metagenome]|uniref:Uncharacterized protein n=1 Tax=marine metagenome TaxID=408172 RepID=A0A382LKI8_9ZZZZ